MSGAGGSVDRISLDRNFRTNVFIKKLMLADTDTILADANLVIRLPAAIGCRWLSRNRTVRYRLAEISS